MKVVKFIGKLFAFLYSMVFFAVLNIFLILIFITNVLGTKFYENIVINIDLSKIEYKDIAQNYIKDKIPSEITVEEKLIDVMEKANIEENKAREIIENEKLRALVGKYIGKSIDYVLGKDELPQIENTEVDNILKEFNLNDKVNDNVDEIISKINKELNDSLNNSIKIPEKVQTLINKFNTKKVVIATIIYIVLSYLIVALLTWNMHKPLLYLGIPLLGSGIIFTMIKLFNGIIFDLLMSNTKIAFIKYMAPIVLNPLMKIGIISLIIGLIFIIVYYPINEKRRKKNLKELTILDEETVENADKKTRNK